MSDEPAKPAERRNVIVPMQLESVRVAMPTWLALKAQARSPHHIAELAGDLLDEWAQQPLKKGRGGARPGAGRPRKSPKPTE